MPLTDEQRRELARRKRALKARRFGEAWAAEWGSRLASIGPLAWALEAAGEQFRIIDMWTNQEWLPDWIPDGYSEIPWELAPSAESYGHEGDRSACTRVIASALASLAQPADQILIIYEEPWLAVRLNCGTAVQNLEAAFAALESQWREMWIAHPQGEWIIRCEEHETLVCGVPAD